MNAVSSILARALVWLVWVPVDRAVCKFANLTEDER